MNCKICNSDKIETINLQSPYYFCQDCELIFIDENEILDHQEEKERYAEHENTPDNPGYVNMFETFIDIVIEPHTEKVKRLLDFGCGPGPVLADLLKEKGFEVDIYDPYFFSKKVYQGKKYDLITSTEVFEHLKDPAKEIENLLLHLNKGGYLAIMTVFHPGVYEFANWWYHRDPTHITFYNSKTFAKIAKKYNLELVFEDGKKYCLFKN
ncbi:class I SAM-dependent methyltransferase [Natronospora cellulosivora (SeqCode)]